jgi:hypothetical protein
MCWFADGTQVQAHSPVDSAVISGLENDDEEPRDEAGILLLWVHQYFAHAQAS